MQFPRVITVRLYVNKRKISYLGSESVASGNQNFPALLKRCISLYTKNKI